MNRISNLSKVLKQSSLWMILIFLLYGGNVYSTETSFFYDATYGTALTSVNSTSGSVSVSSSFTSTSSKKFCNSTTTKTVVPISSSASNDIGENYYQISSTDPISKIVMDMRVVGSTTAADVVVLAWEDTPGATFTEAQLVSAPGYGSACNTSPSDITINFTSSSIKYVRIYRRIKVDNATTPTTVPTSSGSNYGSGTTVGIAALTVTTNASGPTLTVTPTTLTGVNTNLYDGSFTTGSFTVSGTNLTDDVTLTAPADYEISTSATSGWSTTLDLNSSKNSSLEATTIYVKNIASSTGDYNSESITIASTDATSKSVSVSGTVTNTTPLSTPTVGTPTDATSSGFTANWTGVSNAVKYKVYVYKASDLSTVVTTGTTTSTETTLSMIGLDPLTSYVFKVQALGDNSTSANSALSDASSAITTLKSSSASIVCVSEDFETLVPTSTDASSNCPADGTTPTTMIRYQTGSSTSVCSEALLELGSGNWASTYVAAQSGTTHGGSRSLYLYRGGSLQTPTLEMPKKITFYVYNKGSQAANTTGRGFQVLVNGTAKTSGISVDGVELSVSTSTVPSFSSEDNGTIRLGTSSDWHLVSLDLSTTDTYVTIQTIAGNSASDMYIDDVTIYCDPQELTMTPDVSGLDYVEDLGPSTTSTITMTGKDLPVENGTVTLSGPTNFQVSLDNGVTWKTGTINFNYSGDSFTQTALVRLPAGYSSGTTGSKTYKDVFSLTSTGYSKSEPTITVQGKVTLYPISANCGESVSVLNLKGTESSLNLVDASAGSKWTYSGTVDAGTNMLGGYALLVSKSTTLTSPAASASEYDFTTLSFDLQPSSGSSKNIISVQICNGSDCLSSFTASTTDYATKDVYHYSVDLSSIVASGSYTVKITTGSSNSFYIWNVRLDGMAKRKITFTPAALADFISYPDCASDMDTLKVYGTCLDDNSSLNFSSKNGYAYYQISTNGTTWNDLPYAFPYSGEYPVVGETFYVRQKTGLSAGNISDVILVTNGGKGSATIAMSGKVTSSSSWTPADGSTYTYSSVAGVADTVCIPIVGDEFCTAPTATTTCTGLTVSNCKTGSYGSSATFSNTYTTRNLYLKFTPGTLSNCEVDIKAGGETHKVYVNWNGSAVVSSGVQFNASSVSVPVSSYGTIRVNKAGTGDPTVTITSTKFDFSMGNPAFGDFDAITSVSLSELQGILYIKPKSGISSGDSEVVKFTTSTGSTTNLTVTAQ